MYKTNVKYFIFILLFCLSYTSILVIHYIYKSYYVLITLKICFFLASPYGKTKRQRWTKEEMETVFQAFSKHMKNLTLPSLQEIQQAKQKYSCLMHRTSPQIKTWIHNKQKTLRHL